MKTVKGREMKPFWPELVERAMKVTEEGEKAGGSSHRPWGANGLLGTRKGGGRRTRHGEEGGRR